MSDPPASGPLPRGHGSVDGRVLPRFEGIRTFMRLPHVTELAGVDLAVFGIPFDTATSFRSGARFGPSAIRDLSVLLRPYHPGHDVDVFEHLSVIDYGDLPVVPGNIERTYETVARGMSALIEGDVLPLALGGDHSVTLAELRVLAARHGPLALLQFDAHADTWDEYFGERYFHGTTFRRAVEEALLLPECSLQVGIRGSLYGAEDMRTSEELGLRVITAEELRALGPSAFGAAVAERVGHAPVFLSFDVDFADPAYAPGTGTPEIAGFTSAEIVGLLRSLSGIHLVGSDCVELSPPYDSAGQQTALLAANIVWEIVALAAVAARDRAALAT
jgi:agmatinase